MPGQMWATDYLYLRGNLGSALGCRSRNLRIAENSVTTIIWLPCAAGTCSDPVTAAHWPMSQHNVWSPAPEDTGHLEISGQMEAARFTDLGGILPLLCTV